MGCSLEHAYESEMIRDPKVYYKTTFKEVMSVQRSYILMHPNLMWQILKTFWPLQAVT